MKKQEARLILAEHLLAYRQRSYAELVTMIGNDVHREVTAASGAQYQIEVQAFWDDKPQGDVRVMGSIDDGGLRAIFPLTQSFIMTPEGQHVG